MHNASHSSLVHVATSDAIKAMGSIISIEPDVFLQIIRKNDNPLVVYSPASFMTKHKYLTSYKGLTFFAKSSYPITIPAGAELITAKKIAIPQL